MNEMNLSEAERIFHAAMDIENATQRADYLKQECDGNPSLLAQVHRLIAATSAMDDFMPTEPGEVAAEVTISEGAGALIGRYKLLQKLGEGGFGVVYMAEQKEPVKRRVALKIIKLGMDTNQVVGRFEAERQALALMDHPNIAKVLDAGATETGRPYFVMELVKGIPITSYCLQEKLNTKERLELFKSVCRAIQHAHQKGIIHRDIKPSNIMITLHDGLPVPKVIDFGIAKATQQELTERTVFTRYSQFIGTPAYMSPEQAEQSGLDIDTRSDVYSLGVLLYELLTGGTPFDGKSLMEAGLDKMRQTIREEEPVKPSTKVSQTLVGPDGPRIRLNERGDPDRLFRELRGDLDWIVMKCLEKDRARRYDTANALAMDLDRHMKSEPVAARPPSFVYRMEKAWRRNRLAYTAAIFVGFALIFGLVISLWQTGVATRAEAAASLERDRARNAEADSKAAKIEAERSAEEARRNLYAANVHSAHSHLEKGNFGAARRLLESVRPDPGEDGDDRIGWEWRYCVDQLKGDDAVILHQHSVGIGGLALSPDERFLLAGDWNGDVVVWNLETNPPKPQRRFNVSREHPVFGLRFCPLGKYLIAYEPSSEGRLSLYEFGPIRADVTLLERLDVYGADFSPSGDRLAVNLRDKGLSFYDLDERRWLQEMDLPNLSQLRAVTPKAILRDLVYSEDGKRLALSGLHNWIGVVNLGDSELIENRSSEDLINLRRKSGDWVSDNLEFLPGGNGLVTTSHIDPVRRWRLTEKSVELVSTLGGRDLLYPVVDSLRSQIIFPGVDHTVHIWDADTFQETSKLHGHSDEVFGVAVASDGRIYSADLKGQIRLWSQNRERRGVTIPVNSIPVWPVFSPDGSELAVGLDSQKTAVFNVVSGLRRDLITEGIPTKYSDDGQILFLSEPVESDVDVDEGVGRYTGRVIAVDPEDGTKLAEPVGSVLGECNPVLDFGGGIAGTFVWDERERVGINLETGEELFRLPTREDWLFSGLSISPDRRVAILSSSLWQAEGSSIPLEVWDIESYPGRKVAEIEDPFSRMMTWSRFSPDGTLLAVADRDGTVKVFDTATWELRKDLVMDGHHRSIFSVGFSPDGKTLASAGDDGLINLWNVDGGALMVTLSVEGSAQSVVFSPDGKTLAVTVGATFFMVDRIVLYHAPTMEEIELDELLRKHGRL